MPEDVASSVRTSGAVAAVRCAVVAVAAAAVGVQAVAPLPSVHKSPLP